MGSEKAKKANREAIRILSQITASKKVASSPKDADVTEKENQWLERAAQEGR